MNKKRLLSLVLTMCMMASLVPTVAFAADSEEGATTETEFYSGDGTVYVPANQVTQDECWDLDTRIANSNATYWTAGDKLTWKSEMKTTKAGKHNSGWCSSFKSECGHYGEDAYRIEQYLGFSLKGDDATLANLDAPKKVYTVPVVDEEAMETYDDSKIRPSNVMTTQDYEVIDSVTVKTYPTRIIYKQYGTRNSTSKRCGVKNAANEYISFETYNYYVGGVLEVDSLSVDSVNVQYNLDGGIMKKGETLPSAYLITLDGYECEVSSPVRLGYTFKGWKSENDYKGYVFTSEYDDYGKIQASYINSFLWDSLKKLKPGDIGNTITAKWEEADVSLSLDPNGGTIDGSSAVTSLDSISYDSESGKDTSYLDVIPEKNGDEFLGWYVGDTKITCIDDIPQSEWNSDNSYTLTAKWNKKEQEPTELKKIEQIDINNATVSFKAGDKPVFTGTVPSGAPYVIDYESWLGADGEFISSSDYWNSAYVERGWCDELISSFKANTEYSYSLYIKLTDEGYNAGYRFGENTALSINGEVIDINPDYVSILDDGTAAIFSNVVTITPQESEYMIGDANMDGEITVTDATLIQKFCVGLATPENETARKLADVNGDGTISITDATLIQKYLVGGFSDTGNAGKYLSEI